MSLEPKFFNVDIKFERGEPGFAVVRALQEVYAYSLVNFPDIAVPASPWTTVIGADSSMNFAISCEMRFSKSKYLVDVLRSD